MSYADIIHDLEGDKGREWFILRREAYEQAAKADAQIAALTERLRAVEAERDEAKRERDASYKALLDLTPGGSEFHNDPMACISFVKGRLSSASMAKIVELKKELERKDAALKAERQCAENFAEQFAECQWIDMGSYFEVRGPVALMLDSEFAEQAYVARRAALQPTKEPPCQTA